MTFGFDDSFTYSPLSYETEEGFQLSEALTKSVLLYVTR
jgi:hypothetical protein